MQQVNGLSRRQFLGSATALLAASQCAPSLWAAEEKPSAGRVVVGGNPWVYAAPLPKHDITPILPDIFADMRVCRTRRHRVDARALARRRRGRTDRRAQREAPSADHRFLVQRKHVRPHQAQRHSRRRRAGDYAAGQVGRADPRHVGRPGPAQENGRRVGRPSRALRKIIAFGKANGVVLNLHNHTYEIADDCYDLKGSLGGSPM